MFVFKQMRYHLRLMSAWFSQEDLKESSVAWVESVEWFRSALLKSYHLLLLKWGFYDAGLQEIQIITTWHMKTKTLPDGQTDRMIEGRIDRTLDGRTDRRNISREYDS